MSPFFDSNVLVYAYSTDPRRDRALKTIADGGVVSVQVLNEFTNVLRRKQMQDWPVIEAALSSIFFRFPDVRPLTAATHTAGPRARPRPSSAVLRRPDRRGGAGGRLRHTFH